MDIQEIQDTLRDANHYLLRLKKLCTELSNAEQQIEVTSKETEINIQKVFDRLLTSIKLALFIRRDDLLNKATKIRDQGLSPLIECRKVVENKIENTSDFINLGQNLLKSNSIDKCAMNAFNNKSSFLGSLPEVPHLKEVPHLSFQYELSSEKDLIHICQNIGSVIHSSPVQILSLKERPGAILVKWNTSDTDDRLTDVQEFELQKAFGNLINDKHLQDNFRTCYIGSDTQYLAKDLVLNQHYTFRVRCKFEGDAEWSPWSLYEVFSTKLKPFCWRDNEQFVLTNENRIATPLSSSPCMLFSNGTEFNVGYSIEFTFLECDTELNDTFVGLFAFDDIQSATNIINTESICIEAVGSIYGSGSKKSTQFPSVVKGTKICFTCEMKDQNKLRINIDSCGKRVTYDWPINNKQIYFGARFNSSKWKIMLD